jgi:hypothetical protein
MPLHVYSFNVYFSKSAKTSASSKLPQDMLAKYSGKPKEVSFKTLKRQCHKIFYLWFFSSNKPTWAPD